MSCQDPEGTHTHEHCASGPGQESTRASPAHPVSESWPAPAPRGAHRLTPVSAVSARRCRRKLDHKQVGCQERQAIRRCPTCTQFSAVNHSVSHSKLTLISPACPDQVSRPCHACQSTRQLRPRPPPAYGGNPSSNAAQSRAPSPAPELHRRRSSSRSLPWRTRLRRQSRHMNPVASSTYRGGRQMIT